MDSGLKYPTFNVKIKHEGKKALVFDEVRKKWIVLTPEEWVRQHFINYIITAKEFPTSLLSIEKEIELNGTKRRYDAVVFNTAMQPVLLVECKSPDVAITEQTAEQALRYNLVMGVRYLVLTNGLQEIVIDTFGNKLKYLPEIPMYKELV